MAGRQKINRFDVYLTDLEPTRGAEIKKVRPVVVISPDLLNHSLHTVIAAPLTSKPRGFVFRVPVVFKGVEGEIALDHMRSLDKSRCIKKLGTMKEADAERILETLVEFFAA